MLCEQYPTFDEEWRRHTTAQREATLEKIVTQLIARRSPPTTPTSFPTSPISLPTSPNPLLIPSGYPPPLSLSSSSVTPPVVLSSKPRNKPERQAKPDKGHKEKLEKDKEKHERHEKDKDKDKDKHKKDKHDKHEKGPMRLLTRANSGHNLGSEIKSPSSKNQR